MTAVLHDSGVATEPPDADHRWSLLDVAMCSAGLATSVLVGLGGTLGWRSARVVAVLALTVLVATVSRGATGRTRGRVSVAVGMSAMVMAVGFMPHVVKSSQNVAKVATVVLALASIVLLVDGTLHAVRHRSSPRRVGVSAAVIVVSALVVFVVAPPIAATNVPRAQIGATPAVVGLDFESVSLHTPDGVVLAAWYVPSTNGAAVVLLHGAGSTRSTVVEHAAAIAGGGFGVLMVDARGHGESGGRAMDFGWSGDADIAAATAYLASRPDVDGERIGLVGLSMGGEEAVGASATNPLVRAVVAEGATGRNASDDAWLSDVYGARGWIQEQIERVQDWVTSLLTTASTPISLRDAVRVADRTVYLLIAAGTVADEAHAAAYVRAGAPARVETWIVDEAGHARGLQAAPHEWTARVNAFLAAALVSPTRSR